MHAVHQDEGEHEDAEHETEATLACALVFAGGHVDAHQEHVRLQGEVVVVVQVGLLTDFEALQRLTQVTLHPAFGLARGRLQMKQLRLLALQNALVQLDHAGEAFCFQHVGLLHLSPKPVLQEAPLRIARWERGHKLPPIHRHGEQAIVVHHPHFGRRLGALREQDDARHKADPQHGPQQSGHQEGTSAHPGHVFAAHHRAPNVKGALLHDEADSTD